MVDVPEGATAVTCDLFLDPGKSVTVKVQDSEGKPLAGAAVVGVVADQHMEISLDGDDCPVYGLDPDVPRRLLLFHEARNLAATITVRGDETEPIAARLRPAGAIVGRLLDDEGEPISGVQIETRFRDLDAQGLLLHLSNKRKPVRTAKDGRFRLEGVIPDVDAAALQTWGRKNIETVPWTNPKRVAAGQVLDVGDVRARE
jgi:uncharacterized GH25 family protein